MTERQEFVATACQKWATITTVRRPFGMSRKTGSTWLERAKPGATALAGHGRRPHASPQATAPAVVAAVLAPRERYPPGDPGQISHRRQLMTDRPVVRQLVLITDRAPDQQLLRPPLLGPIRQPGAGPVVDSWAFAPGADRNPLPALGRNPRRRGIAAHLHPTIPGGVAQQHPSSSAAARSRPVLRVVWRPLSVPTLPPAAATPRGVP